MAVRTRPYRRRRRGPVIAIVSVLAVIAIAVWTNVLLNPAGGSGATTCPTPAAGPAPGEALASDGLDAVGPLPPASVRVRVLNAGGQRGQANLVAAQLGDLGFGQADQPGNDPFFPDGDMKCVGQIRFGAAGEAAASTVGLVLPCAELVRDARADDTVDVSVGTAFGELNPGRPIRDALEGLGAAPAGSGEAAQEQPAPLDPAVLAAARDADC